MTRVKWSPIELAALADCLNRRDEFYDANPLYHTFHRNYDKIAEYLNKTIHQNQPVRDASSVHSECNAQRTTLPGHRSRYG